MADGGWTWTDGPRPCERRWHYFLGQESICGLRIIDGLQPHELEPAPNRAQKQCAGCRPLLPYLGKGMLARPADVWPKIWLRLPAITAYLRAHHATTTNKQLAALLACGLTNVRNRVYELGLLRMELEYWPDAAVADLCALYTTMGDLEIAALFNARYPKKKAWAKKHIEKKRGYLDLHRTPETLALIHANYHRRPVQVYEHGFKTPGKVGEVRIFRGGGPPRAHIKCADGPWRHYGPILWAQHHGPVPEGHRVYFRDGNAANCVIENLGLVKAGDLAKVARSGSRDLSDKYVAAVLIGTRHDLSREDFKGTQHILLQQPALLDLKRNQMRLTRSIKLAQSNG